MKFNFRKIASVLASTVMISSTVALAAATTLPAPFVQGGQADVLVVYGTNPLASTLDMAAATDIQSYLSNKLTQQTGTGTGTTVTPAGGEVIELNKDSTKMNMGDGLNSVYSQLDSDKLPTILADGTYTDQDGNDHDYQQKIVLSGVPTLAQYVSNNNTVSPSDAPVIGFNIPSNTNLMNYTLTFSDSPVYTSAELQGTSLTMLGRDYYILKLDNSTNTVTFLDSANSIILNSGDSKTVQVGGKSYDVSVSALTTTQTRITVNGVTTKLLKEGQTQKLPDGSYIGIKSIASSSFTGGTQQVEFSIGTGQLIVQDGTNVQVNDNSLTDLKGKVGQSGGKLNSLTLVWTPKRQTDLVAGSELVLPGFEAIKLSMSGMIMGENETLSVKNGGDKYIALDNVEVKDGTVSELPLLYTSNKQNWTGLGKSDEFLVTNATQNPTLNLDADNNPYFVATYISGDTFDSHVYQLQSVTAGGSPTGTKNTTTILDVATGQSFDITNNNEKDVPGSSIQMTVLSTNADENQVVLSLTGGAWSNKLVTKGGLTMTLPYVKTDGPLAGALNLNATTLPSTWVMNFTEADRTGQANLGTGFSATLSGGDTSKGPTVSTTSFHTAGTDLAEDSGSDNYIAYANGFHSTEVYFVTGGDQDYIDVTYHPAEAYAQTFVAESGATFTSGNNETTQTGVLLKPDSDITAETNSNLVVVGGSCVNSVAAQLLGLTYPACGDTWQTATNVASGSYLIQSFPRSGKIATLVAGYNAGDTTNAAMAFKTQTVDTTAGKKYTGTTGTTITPVVTS